MNNLLLRLACWARKWTYRAYEVADEWHGQLERRLDRLP